MKTLIAKYITGPLQTALKQGLSRESLAYTLALGVVVATFPVFGVTTFLCMLIAARQGLNQVVIQVANYVGYPLQILLFIPLIRLGELLFQLQTVSVSPTQMTDMLWQEPMTFIQVYGQAIGVACLAWLILAVPSVFILRKLILICIPVRQK